AILPRGSATPYCVSLIKSGPVAQRLEQWTHNPLVQGSNPCGPTNFSDGQSLFPSSPAKICGYRVLRSSFRFAEMSAQCDNTGMHKSFTTAVHILAAGMLLLGNVLAQEAPAATTPKSSSSAAPSAKAQTPPAKRPATAAKAAPPLTLKTSKDKFSYALGMKMGANLHKQS